MVNKFFLKTNNNYSILLLILVFFFLPLLSYGAGEKGLSEAERSEILKIASIADPLERQKQLAELMKSANKYLEFTLLPKLATTAIKNKDYSSAEKYASRLLSLAKEMKSNWNYGNAIHDGNMVMGLIALENNNINQAKELLLKAGKAPSSPQLSSFGPNMLLADALLVHGESGVVIDYLRLLEKTWTLDEGKLESWIAAIKGGGKPDFGLNLIY